MRVKKSIATFTMIGSLTAAGVMVAGNAWASPQEAKIPAACSGDSCWHVVKPYEPTYAACVADGIALLINGEFGGPFIAYKCVGNQPGNPAYYVLWGETAV